MQGRLVLVTLFASSCTCGRGISGGDLPFCEPSGPCDAPVFDADAGKCSDAFAADGTLCDAGLFCQTGTRCTAGACVGAPVSCDDRNACTTDSCVEGQGCQHTAVQCGADDPCTVYSCDPAVGCGEGTPLADGTVCQLWWEPCVHDATCMGGVCDSPTANAEVPGQTRWIAPFWQSFGPFTIDDGGTSTFTNVYYADGGTTPLGEVFSIDACGKVLWVDHSGTYLEAGPVMRDESQLIVSAGAVISALPNRVVEGLDPATGATRWVTNLADVLQDAGLDAGVCNTFGPPLLAETDQGTIYCANGCATTQAQLIALDRQGNADWVRQLPFGPTGLVADSTGEAYLIGGHDDSFPQPCSEIDGGWPVASLVGLSPAGDTMFVDGLPMWTPPESCIQFVSAWIAADSQGVLVLLHYDGNDDGDVFSGAILRPDGSVRTVLPILHVTGTSAHVDTVITASQNVTLSRFFGEPNAVWGIALDGGATWTSNAGAGTLVLSDDGDVVTETGTGLVALDVATGQVSWTIDAGFLFGTPLLSPTASLIGLNPSVGNEYGAPMAVFGGKHRPSSTAPWSHLGGDNSNRSVSR